MDQSSSAASPKAELALAAAMERAAYHMANSTRRLRVRLITDFADVRDGLVIKATIAAKTGPELEAMQGRGLRVVPWAELDARAGELVTLVDDAVADIEAAISAAPLPPRRPSLSADDLATLAYEKLADEAYEAMTKAASETLNQSAPAISSSLAAEAVAIGALRVAALAGHGARLESDDLKRSLGQAISDVRQRATDGDRPLEKIRFDA